MKVLGLTGSIGMGKSTAARMLRRQGLPVHDSDSEVHHLLDHHRDVLLAITRRFPGLLQNDKIDRIRLSECVVGNFEELKWLESLLHPLVREKQRIFIRFHRKYRHSIVVLEVPLLFETDFIYDVDFIVVVTAPFWVQYSRVMSRVGMTEKKFQVFCNRQIDDRMKRQYADFVLPTGAGRAWMWRRLLRIIKTVKRIRKKNYGSKGSRFRYRDNRT